MKAIINWIVLVPVLVLSISVELFTALNPDGAQSFFGMDVNGITEIVIIAVVALFAVFYLLSLFDRKTSPVHLLRHNYPAGICCVIAAFSLIGGTAANVAEAVRANGLSAIEIIVTLASALAAVALLLVGINHCTASNTKNATAFFYLSVPVWCAVHLISRFMTHTAEPVAMADTLDLVMYVFLAVFFMYAMMVVSLLNGNNPVKAAVYWGAPASVASLVYAISVVGSTISTEGASVFDYLEAVTCASIGLYILAFVAELSFMSKTVEQQYVLTEDTEADAEAQGESEEDDDSSKIQAVEQEAVELPSADEAIGVEIDRSTKMFYKDISSVESEVEEHTADSAPQKTSVDSVNKPQNDYGSYFDSQEENNMYIESENIAVDTSKKNPVNKSKYPTTGENTVREYVGNDDYVVGIDRLDDNQSGDLRDSNSYRTQPHEATENYDSDESSYEARLDEIDRLIISIQGEDADK